MPVEVHIPIRMRVSARALAEHPELVDAALGRAFGRAMGKSRTALRQEFGSYLPPHFGEPAIVWTGEWAHAVPAAGRAEAERRFRRTIRTLARGTTGESAGRTPLADDPAEPFDVRRALGFGRYRIDSYDNGGETAAPLDRLGGTTANTIPFVRDWERATVTDFDRSFVRQRIQGEALVQAVTLSGVYGLIVRGEGNAGWTIIVSADNFNGDHTMSLDFGRQMRRQPVGLRDGQVQYREYELVPPLTSASMTEITLASDRSERLDQLHTLIGASIGAELRDMFDPSQQMDQNLLTPEELDSLIAQEVDAEIERMADGIGTRPTLLRIDWGDMRFHIALESSLAARIGWDPATPATLLPAVDEEQRPGTIPIGTGQEEGDTDEGAGGSGHRARSTPGGGGSQYGTRGSQAGTGTGGRIFPSLGGGSDMCCEPFLEAEPPLSALTGEGERVRRMIAEIAERLDMVPCEYAATFCVGAANLLAGRAYAVGRVAGFAEKGDLTMPVGARAGHAAGGNLGHASFRPVASRGIQLLRRLSQAAARIAELRRAITEIYMHGEGRHLLTGEYYANNPVGWVLRFQEAVSPEMKAGVGEIFAQTCQLVMLQLLDTSAEQIAARQRNLHQYAPLFRDILIRRLSDIGTLTSMRDRLRAYELARTFNDAMGTPAGTVASAALPDWSRAARALADACVSTEGFAHLPGATNEIVTENGVAKIRDAHGFMWTREALEQAIAEQRGAAESMDPLIQQLSDIPETVELFRRDPDSAEPLLSGLLERMAGLNAEKRFEAAMDWRFGLRVGRISESAQSTLVPGLPYDLAGVHLIAHQQIYPFFGSETAAYAEGVDHIFSVELGIQAIEHFFVFTGLVLLAVICAPAAFAAGVAVAAREVDRAEARRDLYRSLINPELVLNRTEVELECYIAYVGLALSLLPEAGTAARAISVGVRGAARRGVSVGLALAGRSIVRHVSRQVTEQLAREMLPALLREFATNLLMEQVIVPAVVGPIIGAVEREMRVRMSVGGIAGAEQLIQQIEAEAARRRDRPLPGAAAPTATTTGGA